MGFKNIFIQKCQKTIKVSVKEIILLRRLLKKITLFLYFHFITSIREHNELQEENAKGKVGLYRWIDRPSMNCL